MPFQSRYRPLVDSSWGNWDKPINLRLGRSSTHVVHSPQEALKLMSSEWPGERGDSYHQARRACLAFLKRQASPAQVRRAFLVAAAETGLLH
ncbi:hypothetical protein ABID21_001767 [Pseudorhizobium tarimense]|uniref:DUF982 domain-containing protein n=1 Tax=Pseudorhizobium tarimense TaxID=1079109 RepID=A0ABV2H533_9HYPH